MFLKPINVAHTFPFVPVRQSVDKRSVQSIFALATHTPPLLNTPRNSKPCVSACPSVQTYVGGVWIGNESMFLMVSFSTGCRFILRSPFLFMTHSFRITATLTVDFCPGKPTNTAKIRSSAVLKISELVSTPLTVARTRRVEPPCSTRRYTEAIQNGTL